MPSSISPHNACQSILPEKELLPMLEASVIQLQDSADSVIVLPEKRIYTQMNRFRLPYKSKRRDEQQSRLLAIRRELLQVRADLLFGDRLNKGHTIQPGNMFFSQRPKFIRILNAATRFNKKELSKLYAKDFKLINQCLDDFWIIISRYTMAVYQWVEVKPHPMQELLFSCLYKNLLSVYVCHKLTMDGLFGLGRPHLRHIFESLMIAKFCAIDASTEVYDRWADGIDVYLSEAILKNIVRPSTTEFSEIWKQLCRYSHATIYAGQVGFTLEETKEGTKLNISLTVIFMQWMYHLIYKYMVTRTMRYYGDYYAPTQSAEKARVRLRKAFQSQRKLLPPASLRLDRHYCASWKLK
jgi:hypothetical protein